MKSNILGVFEQIKGQITQITEIKNRLEQDIGEIQRENARRKIIESIVFHETRLPIEAISGILEISSLVPGAHATIKNGAAASALRFNLELLSYLESFLTPEFDPDFYMETEFDFNEIMFTALCSVYNKFVKRGVRLSIRFFDSPVIVKADKYKLYCVLLNLLDNAFKFGAAKDEVVVSTGISDDGMLKVELLDHGAGFDEESLRSFFPKGRLSVELEKNDPKTGLLIVYKYLQEMGGYLEAESRSEEGVAMTLSLKLSEKADVKALGAETPDLCDFSDRIMQELTPDAEFDGALKRIRRPAEPDRPPTRTVMIIDDDFGAVGEFKNAVEALQDQMKTVFRVIDLAPGPLNLDVVRSYAPDIVFVEPMLKNSDGFAVIEKIKKGEGTSNINIVALSRIKCKVRSMNLGASAYIQKPLKEAALLEVFNKFIPGRTDDNDKNM